jgi:hypothetical protein
MQSIAARTSVVEKIGWRRMKQDLKPKQNGWRFSKGAIEN